MESFFDRVKFWNQNAPKKIKLWTYQACREVLHTKANRKRKQLQIIMCERWATCGVFFFTFKKKNYL